MINVNDQPVTSITQYFEFLGTSDKFVEFVDFNIWQYFAWMSSTLNTDYLLWHTQLIVCAVKSWVIIFTFQVYGENTFKLT